MAWQPIETTPTNGTPVDLWVRHIDGIEYRECGMVLVEGEWRRTCGRVLMSSLESVLTPTHWMPAPEGPHADGAQGGSMKETIAIAIVAALLIATLSILPSKYERQYEAATRTVHAGQIVRR